MDKQGIARKFTEIRKKRRLSQRDLAQNAGVAQRSIEQIEAGEGNPTLGTLAALAGALDAPLTALIDPPSTKGAIPLPDFEASVRLLSELSQLDPDYQRIVLSLIYGDVAHMRGRPQLAALIPKIEALIKLR